MTILFEKSENGVARITLNRPEVHNAFNAQMIADLNSILVDLDKCQDTHIVLLSGAGKSFSAGADLEWMKQAAGFSYDENYVDAMKLSNMLNVLYRLKQLVITSVQGASMGGAIGLLSCSDIVIADRGSKFSFSEVKLGLIPSTISPFVINAIGPRQAKRFFQTGEIFSADKALEIGLVHEISSSEEDSEAIIEGLIKGASLNAPIAMKEAKKLVLDYQAREINDDLRHKTAHGIARIRAADEAVEGLSAFFEKRKPDWKRDV